ncbi:AraC family transcriptional regulator [Neorhizobium sp. JUb45]|uniref:helix-turn-helix transcriptional regulator n=1 Tax=unclassified Neorhizobium TaxID=2629175 RepID=UPI0010D3BD88|nr:AraC family transcriptional regulator [Neorhizobium sp. JUb45]TCQ99981.1 AraC-like DNA-binding protein [Neorhizobium sp. JUb45]
MAMNAVSISRADAFGGFDVLESRVRRFEYAPHRHAEVVIAAYTAGRKLARCEKQEFGIGPGDLLVIGPETLHAAATVDDAGWHYQSIYLQMEQIAEATGLGLSEVDRRVGGYRLYSDDTPALRFREALEDPLALADFLLEIFPATPLRQGATALHGKSTTLSSIRIVHDLLADDPAATPTLPQLAVLAGVSPEHLSRRFRAAYGLSPFQFLSVTRARVAKDMMAGGSPIGEAAHATGFADQSHLTRWFKRVYGVTPGEFAQCQMRSRL